MIPSLAVCAVATEMVRGALRNYGQFSLVHYVRQRSAGHEMDKEHMKCIVHRIPNDFRIADSARAAIVLSQGRLAFKLAAGAVVGYSPKAHKMDPFIPARCSLTVHVHASFTGNITINRQSSRRSLSHFEASLRSLTRDM
jgi:hypothetical protein